MRLLRRLRFLVPSYRERVERDVDEELAALAEIASAEDGRDGRRELGNLARAKEEARELWVWSWAESLFADARYAFRVLRKQRGFATVAIVSLALGIGANAAIFSIIDRLLLQQLPVQEPDRLVNFGRSSFSYFACTEFGKYSTQVLSGVLCTDDEVREVDTGGQPARANIELVTGGYFDVLGITGGRGRMLALQDDLRSRPAPVAVISHDFWNRRLGGDPGVLGRTIRIQGAAFSVVGVAPAEFFGVVVGRSTDVWIPITTFTTVYPGRNWLDRRTTNFLLILGRLRPGVTPEAAAAMLTPVSVQINLDRFPNEPEEFRRKVRSEKVHLEPAAKGISYIRARFSQPLQIVFAMVGLALLLACVNLMNLQLARSSERHRELEVRLAIGASRARIVRQLLIESLLLAFAGGAVGILIAGPVANALTSLVHTGGATAAFGNALSSKVLLFALGVSVVAALVFGVAPAWRATRVDFAAALQQSGRTSTAAPRRRRIAQGLAAFQVALSVFLVAGACLFAASLYKLTHFHAGLDRSRLVMLDVDGIEAGLKGRHLTELHRRLRDRLGALPGVEAVSFSENGVYGGRNSNTSVRADGFPQGSGPDYESFYDQVGPEYFTTIGGSLIDGRDFTARDDSSGPRVAIVNEEFARHFFPSASPVGRKIYLRGGAPLEVVGLVKDIRSENIRRPARRLLYLPQLQTQDELSSTRFLVRTKVDPVLLFSSLRSAVRTENPTLPVLSIDTADSLLQKTLDRDRLIATLSVGFGLLALVLAGVGTYGLLSYEVARRTGEVGIRVALGARRGDILTLILVEVGVIALAGVVAGIGAAVASGQIVTTLVFGVEPSDPRVLASAAGILLSVALFAGLLPARRAARMEPMVALRHE